MSENILFLSIHEYRCSTGRRALIFGAFNLQTVKSARIKTQTLKIVLPYFEGG